MVVSPIDDALHYEVRTVDYNFDHVSEFKGGKVADIDKEWLGVLNKRMSRPNSLKKEVLSLLIFTAMQPTRSECRQMLWSTSIYRQFSWWTAQTNILLRQS